MACEGRIGRLVGGGVVGGAIDSKGASFGVFKQCRFLAGILEACVGLLDNGW